MNYILITGADGYLGGKLSKKIADYTDYGVIAVGRTLSKISSMIQREGIINKKKLLFLANNELTPTVSSNLSIIGGVHFAFSRVGHPYSDIADSLDYSLKVFRTIVEAHINNFIYISSQSIYGECPDIRTEKTIPAPNSVYAMAKYAGEKLFEACYAENENLQHTILRLDNVIQSQNLVNALCRNAIDKHVLHLVGGKQVFSYIDARDVPDAIIALFDTHRKWQNVYNLGPQNMRVSLCDIGKMIKEIAFEHHINISLEFEPSNTELWAGMDSSRFKEDTGWTPMLSLKRMVNDVFEKQLSDYN